MKKTKKKNPLSLREHNRPIYYYFRHPIKGFKDIYWNVRNFFHRGRYGYAYVDVWNFYYWWTTVGAEALRYLAENGIGYPGIEPWDTPERWNAYLLSMADQLDLCVKSCDWEKDDAEKRAEIFAEIGRTLPRFWD